MERFRKYLLVTLGFALAGAIGAAFGTGKAEAVVASLVQIANTTSSPVPSLNMTDPGRVAYQSTVNNVGKCSGSRCDFNFGTVSSGHRVVIQHVGGTVGVNPLPQNILVGVFSGGSPFITTFFAPVLSTTFTSAFDQSVLFYVDSGDAVTVEVLASGNSATFEGDSISQFVTLTGYELDCTVAACAPIARQ